MGSKKKIAEIQEVLKSVGTAVAQHAGKRISGAEWVVVTVFDGRGKILFEQQTSVSPMQVVDRVPLLLHMTKSI